MKRDLTVIDEDEYAMGLSNVVERDYFPELQDLRDKKDYMQAERLDDQRKMQEVQYRKRLRAEEESEKKPLPPGLSSVDAYLGTYTSEDNASFVVLQQEELAKKKELDVWGKRQAKLQEIEASKKALLLEDNKDKEKVLAIEYGNQQLLGIVPIDKSKELYEKQLVVAGVLANERVIEPVNTRFNAADVKRVQEATKKKNVPAQEKRKKLSEIVQTNRFLQGANSNDIQQVDLDDFFPVNEEEEVEDEPNVNGYSFIATPQIVPGVGVDESPLVSWGTVNVLNMDTKGRQFKIPNVPERDRVAQKLTESVSYSTEKMKQRGATPILGKSPVFSPAGQKLLEQRKKSLSMQSPFFKTPIGKTTPGRTPSRKSSSSKFLTPVLTPKLKEKESK